MSFANNWGTFDFGKGLIGATISDLHLGHDRNDTPRMAKAIKKNLIHSGLMSRLDVLMCTGDIFDHGLLLDDPNAIVIDNLFDDIFEQCEKHNVVFIAVRGTPSHDHHQPDRLEHLYKLGEYTFEFFYRKDVAVEHSKTKDFTVLFVPDEYQATTEITKDLVKNCLQAKGLEQVDLGCMHGMFPHQVTFKTKPTSLHDPVYYQEIVRDWVMIGHIHKHSAFDKIVAPSSHDRLRQNEEDPKGFVVFTFKCEKPQLWFIENVHAHIHKNLTIYGDTVEEAQKKVEDFLKDKTEKVFLRVEAESNHPLFSLFNDIQAKWPLHNLESFSKSEAEKEEMKEIDDDGDWGIPIINKNNIEDLIGARILAKHGQAQCDRSIALMKDLL